MLVALTRIIKYGVQSFLRNGWLSVSTIIIMILALVVFEGLIIFNFIGKQTIASIQEKVDISVYFKSNVPEDSILNVKRSLENLEEVKFVEYVSREKALEDFKTKHKEDDTILRTLGELDENPLLASLNVKAKSLNQYGAIASYLEAPSLGDIVEKITYAQNQIVISRLSALLRSMNQVMAVLTIFLAFLAAVVTFNTIRLAIFSNRDQVEIMRLVGASNSFIQGPFIVEGIIYGVLSALVSFVLYIPVIQLSSPRISSFASEINLLSYLNSNWENLILYQLAFGLGLSIVSSVIAVRRYLKK